MWLVDFIVGCAGLSGRMVWGEGLDCLDTDVGLNPAQDIDVHPCLSVLYCPLEVEALWQADPLSKESNQVSNWFKMSECNSEPEQVQRPFPFCKTLTNVGH
jgi:hypothetical protein